MFLASVQNAPETWYTTIRPYYLNGYQETRWTNINEQPAKLYMKLSIDKDECILEVNLTATYDLNSRARIAIIPHVSAPMT